MAIRKSQIYQKLWQSCDALRGAMDASQYKDYVLVMLFIKYISDKAGQVPPGASFSDMVKLKGKADIGQQINERILTPLAEQHELTFPDFNDELKLGKGAEMVKRLTSLIGIFEDKALNFTRNRMSGDDLLGDAYEYLMRHFATESGKSKGQFYTPSEVSRVMAQLLGIGEAHTSGNTTVYDPTCGSGSLLLKVAEEAGPGGNSVSLYGQEMDVSTGGLAKMNMIVHTYPTAEIVRGSSTLANPLFIVDGGLKQFDYIVANPPFSYKDWTSGFDPAADTYNRFSEFGMPPAKQGDYAFLLHIVASLKHGGTAACILPHGVLFRGNAEADIRRNLLRKGYINGIIGLPANLFYGTGIPACIVVIKKSDEQRGVFLIDASHGFIKDGNKHRLREQDIHKIIDVWRKRADVPRYARLVDETDIARHDYNLNLPRYIDTGTPEDRQDIDAHLRGDIPDSDIDALDTYWRACPSLREALFTPARSGYQRLRTPIAALRQTINDHTAYVQFINGLREHFHGWRETIQPQMAALTIGCAPKTVIMHWGEQLLAHYANQPLLDQYTIYQHLMDYWEDSLQDDLDFIAGNGWQAIIENDGKRQDWECDLLPKAVVTARYFADEQATIDALRATIDDAAAAKAALAEENSGEDGVFGALDSITHSSVKQLARELRGDLYARDALAVIDDWLAQHAIESEAKKQLKSAAAALDARVRARYDTFDAATIRTLVIEDKWLVTLATKIADEIDRITERLAQRLSELAERYQTPLPVMSASVDALSATVQQHLRRMGFALDG